MTQSIQHTITVPDIFAGDRLDQVIAKLITDYSRMRLKTWIESGYVTINNQIIQKPRYKVTAGDQIKLQAPFEVSTHLTPQEIRLNILYEDEDLLVINKPAGIIVHPAAGNFDHTLVNALLFYLPDLNRLPRAGLIHRIDKDTTGLLIVAKTLPAHTALVKALKDHEIHREYQAIVHGVMTKGGTVDAPIGRHPNARVKMAVTATGKPATSHYRVIKRYVAHTHIHIALESGRTHQIRVHMAHIRYPIVGDRTYGGRFKLHKGASPALIEILQQFKRQALHAYRLSFMHPRTGKPLAIEAPLPEDMKKLIENLENELRDKSLRLAPRT